MIQIDLCNNMERCPRSIKCKKKVESQCALYDFIFVEKTKLLRAYVYENINFIVVRNL